MTRPRRLPLSGRVPWPSWRWHARRRIDIGHAGQLHGSECARGHVRPAGVARRPREGPSLRRAEYLRTADWAVDTAHGRAGGTNRHATERL